MKDGDSFCGWGWGRGGDNGREHTPGHARHVEAGKGALTFTRHRAKALGVVHDVESLTRRRSGSGAAQRKEGSRSRPSHNPNLSAQTTCNGIIVIAMDESRKIDRIWRQRARHEAGAGQLLRSKKVAWRRVVPPNSLFPPCRSRRTKRRRPRATRPHSRKRERIALTKTRESAAKCAPPRGA